MAKYEFRPSPGVEYGLIIFFGALACGLLIFFGMDVVPQQLPLVSETGT